MSHQSLDSSLLAESSLTDSEESASDCVCALSATCKRKSDCDSAAMQPTLKDERLIFHHIVIARSNLPMYTGLAWYATLLWNQIAVATGLPVISVLNCVSYYRDLYDQYPGLDCLTDSLLRTSVICAFQDKPFESTKGCVELKDLLNVRSTILKEQLQRPDPLPESSSDYSRNVVGWDSDNYSRNVVGWASDNSGRKRIIDRNLKKRKEDQAEHLPVCTSNELYNQIVNEISQDKFSHHIALSQQCSGDIAQLKLSIDESKRMLEMYGPYSKEYMGMFSQPQKTRLEMLMALLENWRHAIESGSSKSSVNTTKKRNEQFL